MWTGHVTPVHHIRWCDHSHIWEGFYLFSFKLSCFHPLLFIAIFSFCTIRRREEDTASLVTLSHWPWPRPCATDLRRVRVLPSVCAAAWLTPLVHRRKRATKSCACSPHQPTPPGIWCSAHLLQSPRGWSQFSQLITTNGRAWTIIGNKSSYLRVALGPNWATWGGNGNEHSRDGMSSFRSSCLFSPGKRLVRTRGPRSTNGAGVCPSPTLLSLSNVFWSKLLMNTISRREFGPML